MLRYQSGEPAYKKMSHRKLAICLAVYYIVMLPILCLVYARSIAGVATSDMPVIVAVWVASLAGLWWRWRSARQNHS